MALSCIRANSTVNQSISFVKNGIEEGINLYRDFGYIKDHVFIERYASYRITLNGEHIYKNIVLANLTVSLIELTGVYPKTTLMKVELEYGKLYKNKYHSLFTRALDKHVMKIYLLYWLSDFRNRIRRRS